MDNLPDQPNFFLCIFRFKNIHISAATIHMEIKTEQES